MRDNGPNKITNIRTQDKDRGQGELVSELATLITSWKQARQ
jgi:hypothetical protein